jgi:hypothetical protein
LMQRAPFLKLLDIDFAHCSFELGKIAKTHEAEGCLRNILSDIDIFRWDILLEVRILFPFSGGWNK